MPSPSESQGSVASAGLVPATISSASVHPSPSVSFSKTSESAKSVPASPANASVPVVHGNQRPECLYGLECFIVFMGVEFSSHISSPLPECAGISVSIPPRPMFTKSSQNALFLKIFTFLEGNPRVLPTLVSGE